jgi:hypothetical protein
MEGLLSSQRHGTGSGAKRGSGRAERGAPHTVKSRKPWQKQAGRAIWGGGRKNTGCRRALQKGREPSAERGHLAGIFWRGRRLGTSTSSKKTWGQGRWGVRGRVGQGRETGGRHGGEVGVAGEAARVFLGGAGPRGARARRSQQVGPRGAAAAGRLPKRGWGERSSRPHAPPPPSPAPRAPPPPPHLHVCLLHHVPYADVEEKVGAALAVARGALGHGRVGRVDEPAAVLLVPPPLGGELGFGVGWGVGGGALQGL